MSLFILSIEKLQEIINCKTPSKHAFSDWIHSDGNALLTFFSFSTSQSVNQPTPGDYTLPTQSNTHSVIGALIIKEVVQQGRVNELIPSQM